MIRCKPPISSAAFAFFSPLCALQRESEKCAPLIARFVGLFGSVCSVCKPAANRTPEADNWRARELSEFGANHAQEKAKERRKHDYIIIISQLSESLECCALEGGLFQLVR